jgi:hypothetical protein
VQTSRRDEIFIRIWIRSPKASDGIGLQCMLVLRGNLTVLLINQLGSLGRDYLMIQLREKLLSWLVGLRNYIRLSLIWRKLVVL